MQIINSSVGYPESGDRKLILNAGNIQQYTFVLNPFRALDRSHCLIQYITYMYNITILYNIYYIVSLIVNFFKKETPLCLIHRET